MSAFFHYAYQDSGKLTVFKNWVLENHIYQAQDTQADEIIKIFDCVLEARKRTIFVSMQFSAETEGNYQAIKDAVDSINNSFSLDLKIREIRIDQFKKGYSYKVAGADFNADHGFNIKTYQVLLATDTNDLRQKIIAQVKSFIILMANISIGRVYK